jgi:hypothetical protein
VAEFSKCSTKLLFARGPGLRQQRTLLVTGLYVIFHPTDAGTERLVRVNNPAPPN